MLLMLAQWRPNYVFETAIAQSKENHFMHCQPLQLTYTKDRGDPVDQVSRFRLKHLHMVHLATSKTIHNTLVT